MAILRDFFTFNLALFELVNNIYYIEPWPIIIPYPTITTPTNIREQKKIRFFRDHLSWIMMNHVPPINVLFWEDRIFQCSFTTLSWAALVALLLFWACAMVEDGWRWDVWHNRAFKDVKRMVMTIQREKNDLTHWRKEGSKSYKLNLRCDGLSKGSFKWTKSCLLKVASIY